MYSKKDENKIRNLERENFHKLKNEENKNRNIPLSDDILYISDFNLKKFFNSRDSGNLYLAINKYNNINIREFANKTILESAQRNTDRNRLFY